MGYRMLVRMGWVPGTGLGRNGCGIVVPVTAADAPVFEGVGLGCVEVSATIARQDNLTLPPRLTPARAEGGRQLGSAA